MPISSALTLWPPIPLTLYTLPYWSNPPFLIFDIWALWRSGLSARAPECQKLKPVGQTSMALNPSNSSNLEKLALKGLIERYLIARHSQTTAVPMCPPGTEQMWEGYSMLFLQGNSKAHGQDLGKICSCYHTLQYNVCATGNVAPWLVVGWHGYTGKLWPISWMNQDSAWRVCWSESKHIVLDGIRVP